MAPEPFRGIYGMPAFVSIPTGDPGLGGRSAGRNTRDIAVTTPENARVVLTAAKPFDPAGQEARNLEAIGITAPRAGRGDNEDRA